jgi:hypothetical protein
MLEYEQQAHKKMLRQKGLTGLLYGILAGLGFAFFAWGIAALRLSGAHAGAPWLQFFLGAGICMAIGAAAGWLTARSDNSLVGVVCWLAAGILFAWIAGHLPFEGMSLGISLFTPELQDTSYIYPENMRSRMVVVYIVIIICSTLAGALENVIVDSARAAATPVASVLILLLVIPFFALAGWVVTDYIIQPLTDPLIAVDDLLQFGIQVGDQPVDAKTSAEKHYKALNPIKHLMREPYQLYLGGYEPIFFETFTVFINFDGVWATCSVFSRMVGVCKPGTPFAEAPTASTPTTSPSAKSSPDEQPSPAPPATPTAGDLQPTASQSSANLEAPGQEAALVIDLDQLPAGLDSAPRYQINLEVDYDQLTFTGQQVLDFTNLEDIPLDVLNFRLIPNGRKAYGDGELNVSQVTLDGNKLETRLLQQDTVLQVSLPEPLAPLETVQFDFQFDGRVPRDYGADQSGYGVYNYTDGVLAMANWYPILAVYDEYGWNLDMPSAIGDSVYSETAYYDVTIAAPEDLIIAATGKEIDAGQTDHDGKRRFISGPVRDFFLIMSPDFEVDSQVVDGTQVNSYYLPGHKDAGAQALEIASDSLGIFNERFGAYPYRELDVIDGPMLNAAGVEFPGIVMVASNLYDNPDQPTFTVATAHEVAHQWWYNVVGNDVFADPWLDEALTTYSSSLYYEFTGNGFALRSMLDNWEKRVSEAASSGLDESINRPLNYFERPGHERGYGVTVYTKGALFFAALRKEIGDQAFFAALQDYYQRYQYQVARPQDLLDAFERSANRQLDDFYQSWITSSP